MYAVDKFGGSNVLRRDKLQLVGVASLFLACKACEEPNRPDADYLAYLTANAYSAEEVRSFYSVSLLFLLISQVLS